MPFWSWAALSVYSTSGVGRSPNDDSAISAFPSSFLKKTARPSRMNGKALIAAWLSSTVTAIVNGSVAGLALNTLAHRVVLADNEVGGRQPGHGLAAASRTLT